MQEQFAARRKGEGRKKFDTHGVTPSLSNTFCGLCAALVFLHAVHTQSNYRGQDSNIN